MGLGSILIVDDDEHIVRLFKLSLDALGYEVETAIDREQALDQVRDHRFDLVIMDLFIGDIRGDGLAIELDGVGVPLKYVFLTGYTNMEKELKAAPVDVFEVLLKPVSLERLAELVQEAIPASDEQ
jgi:DNA-binding NtrC family response regulator